MPSSTKTSSGARRKAPAKKSQARKNTAKNSSRKKQQPVKNNRVHEEIAILCILAVSIVLLISNLGIGGIIGNAISSFAFGVFGLVSYIFPFLLFFGIIFYISNRRNALIRRKMVGAFGCVFFLCGFLQLLTVGYNKSNSIIEYYQLCADEKIGGGIIGALQVKLFCTGFGTIGAYVIIVIALVIFAIVMTQKPLLTPLKEGGARAYQTASRNRKERSDAAKEKRKEKQAQNREAFGAVDFPLSAEIPSSSQLSDDPAAVKKEPVQKAPEPIGDIFSKELNISIFEETPETPPEVPTVEAVPEPVTDVPQKDSGLKESRKKVKSSTEEIKEGISDIENAISSQDTEKVKSSYKLPPLRLLGRDKNSRSGNSGQSLKATAMKLQQTLKNFGVNVTISDVSCGPAVTRYELQPEQGVKVSKIVSLADDIKLNLAAADIRIEAPIPGKAAVGIEVPNKTNSAVFLRELLESKAFQEFPSSIAFAVGKDIAGKPVITDIAKMPHLLIAGATGSGKSVCINTLIMSILYKAHPDEVKLIMIDPKVVELSIYNGIPHLYIPVVTDPKKAAGALNWAVAEMTDRYNKFAEYNVRDLRGYNAKVDTIKDVEDENKPQKMPQIVIIVDELADLMMVAPGEVEDAICRLAQLARAAGIHLIIATQRPSVNVITGLIKANMPSRIAFSVSSGVDSRTILDMNGAEKLLGKGDMLFYPQGFQKPARVQGSFVTDKEVGNVVSFISDDSAQTSYNTEIANKINNCSAQAAGTAAASSEQDAHFMEAGKFIIEKDKASIGMLQRVFKIGFNRAARIMDQLSDAGVVGPEEGTKPRKVLMSLEEFEKYVEEFL